MSERMTSLLILGGAAMVILAIWVLSVLAVRWDTRRRNLTEMERNAWLAIAIILPMFGFALYLAMRVMRRYLTPPPENFEDERMTSVKPRVPAWRDVPQQEPALFAPRSVPQQRESAQPSGKLGTQPGKPGYGGNGHDRRTAATIPAPYQPLLGMFVLIALEGAHAGQQFILAHLPTRLGRGPEAGIPLDADLNVSRRHAEIYEWNGALRIRDLQSTHGTLINGQRITDQSLAPGDRIQVGGSVFVLREVS
jgi:hypothetical protein